MTKRKVDPDTARAWNPNIAPDSFRRIPKRYRGYRMTMRDSIGLANAQAANSSLGLVRLFWRIKP